MRILNRYLAREIFVVFFICLFSFLIFILIGRLLHFKELFLGQNVQIKDIALAFFYLSPSFLIILIPISCMLSIFLVFLRMTSDREMIALRSCSLNYTNFTYFPFLFSVICFFISLYMAIVLLPKGIDNFREKCIEIIQSKTEFSLRPGIFSSSFPGIVIYPKSVDLKTKIMQGIFIEENRKEQNRVIVADKGYIYYDKDNNRMVFELLDGNIYIFSNKNSNILNYKRYDVILDLKNILGGFKLEDKKPKEMYLSELKKVINSDSELSRIAKMELSRRLALPFSCLILSFFVLPLSLSLSGMKQQYGIIICLLSFLIYYSLYSLFYSLGETGKMYPYISMWMPNLIFLVLGGINFYLLSKEVTLYGVIKNKLLKR